MREGVLSQQGTRAGSSVAAWGRGGCGAGGLAQMAVAGSSPGSVAESCGSGRGIAAF